MSTHPLRAGVREQFLDTISLDEPQLIDEVRKAEAAYLKELAMPQVGTFGVAPLPKEK